MAAVLLDMNPYESTNPIPEDANESTTTADNSGRTPYLLPDVLFFCAPVVFFIAGILLLIAGKNWYRGNWWRAGGFTIAAVVVTQSFTFSIDYLETWGGNIY